MLTKSPPVLTVIICTYRRHPELTNCLASLEGQVVDQRHKQKYLQPFKVLVVDNAGEEKVVEITRKSGCDYIHEPQIGLSHARNRGARTATTPWILYLDDDAKARPNLVNQALKNSENNHYAMIGGRFEHWHASPPPRWFPFPFEGEGRPVSASTLTELAQDDYLFGGVMLIHRATLLTNGGFDPQYGMQGNQLAYGEENDLQVRLRKIGKKIAYDPEMIIDHLVAKKKYTLSYHLETAYRHGLYSETRLAGEKMLL